MESLTMIALNEKLKAVWDVMENYIPYPPKGTPVYNAFIFRDMEIPDFPFVCITQIKRGESQHPVAPEAFPTKLRDAIKNSKVLRYRAHKWVPGLLNASYNDVDSFWLADMFTTAALELPADINRENFNLGHYNGFVSFRFSNSVAPVHLWLIMSNKSHIGFTIAIRTSSTSTSTMSWIAMKQASTGTHSLSVITITALSSVIITTIPLSRSSTDAPLTSYEARPWRA